jgi:hypothetical protein
MSQNTPETVDRPASRPSARPIGSAPWFILFYFCAFFLLMEMDWKLGTAWLLWRLAHSARKAWEEKEQNVAGERPGK